MVVSVRQRWVAASMGAGAGAVRVGSGYHERVAQDRARLAVALLRQWEGEGGQWEGEGGQ
jgi:hypothetical protein